MASGLRQKSPHVLSCSPMADSLSEIYFHEDDYCQQEILPLSSFEFCREQVNEIDGFSEQHKCPNGLGWTDVFVRKNSPESLGSLAISLNDLRDALGDVLPEIPVIYTGYSTYREKCTRTAGFGFDDDCVVYADWNDSGHIEHLWTSLFTTESGKLERAVDAIQNFGKSFPLLYVDWAWGFATPLDQSPSLLNRIESKIKDIEGRRAGINT